MQTARSLSMKTFAVAKPTGTTSVRKASKPVSEVKLFSTAAPFVAAAPVVDLAVSKRGSFSDGIAASLQGPADYFNTLGLPDWLIHWGHPGNMGVVLLAMGFYGTLYSGWTIRTTEDEEALMSMKKLHVPMAIGMSTFFALGATGGMMSLLMQGKPIFESAHVTTGLTGLALLALQGMLSLFFDDDPQARNLHAYFGTGIMALFVVHAGLGLQLGLSI